MKRVKKKRHIFAWTLLGITILMVLAGVACGYMAYRFYQNIRPTVIVEAGGLVPDEDAFQNDTWDTIHMETTLSGIDTTKTGVHPVKFTWGPLEKDAELFVQDTTAPKGEVRDLTVELGEEPTVEDFIVSMEDVTGVTAYFSPEPDYTFKGTQKVTIMLEDGSGNRTELKADLTTFDPTETPVLNGVMNITIYEGDSISYRNGVSVTAQQDPDPELTIDNSKVDLNTPGEYPVVYTATDRYGRSTAITVTVTVKEKDQEYYDTMKVNQLTEEILAKEVTPEMDEIETIFAIFRWVRRNVPWVGARTERDPIGQTLRGLQGYGGDCYTHAITCKTLLDRAGVENIMMKRYPGPGVHYWLMVKVGEFWYHLDPSPIYMDRLICFLCTDQDVATFSETVRPSYYAYEYGTYPYTPDFSPAKVIRKNGDYELVRLDQEGADPE